MTCHCFLQPVTRDLTSSSYTPLSHLFPLPIIHSALTVYFVFYCCYFLGGGVGDTQWESLWRRVMPVRITKKKINTKTMTVELN